MTDVVHLGSRPLSHRCLELLDEADGIDVAGVVTRPPDHDGWWEGSLHEVATDLGYDVIDEAEILDRDVDYLMSTLYYDILGPRLLEHPTHGGLNLHQAELPRYRGSHSFSHAILNAREDDYWRYGTTLHVMTEEVDEGPIVDRAFVEIAETDTARSLYRKVERRSLDLFERNLPHVRTAEIDGMATPQSEYGGPTYYYTSDELEPLKEVPVAWFGDEERAPRLRDRVRALEFPPFEPAYVEVGGERLYLTSREYGGLS